MDEGIKARIDLAPPASMTPAERSRAAAGAPMRNAFHLIRKSSHGTNVPLDPYFAVRDRTVQAITLASTMLLGNNLPNLAPLFHDLTTHSAGVLADVTTGGLRKDLSLFGELPEIPNEYRTRRIYSDSDAPLGQIPSSPSYNGGSPDPHWSLIYDHLNIRKRLETSIGNQLPTLPIGSTLP